MSLMKVLDYYNVELNHQNKTCCPFHEDSTPSFQYYEETDSCYCFGCPAQGDGIDFIKLKEGVDFKEATKIFKEITGEEFESKPKQDGGRMKEKKSTLPLPLKDLKALAERTTYQNLNYRGIRKETDEFFKHRSTIVNGKVTQRFYPETNDDGAITGMKCRNDPKDFTHGKIGVTGLQSQLSGQFKFKSGGKYILIVGGEEDKGAAYQMFVDRVKDSDDYNPTPVVSPTSGESSAVKQLASQYDFLDGFDNIILGFDNDEAGIKAAKDCLDVLPKEKVSIARWSMKDPNEMLLAGKKKQFYSDFFNAKPAVATGVKSSVEALEGVKEFLTAPKISLPPQMHRVEDAMRGGIKSSGCIGNIIADTSVGKSLLSDTCIYHWILKCDIVPVIVSIERTAEEFTADMLSMHLKKNLVWFKDGQDAVDYLERGDVKELYQDLIQDEDGKPRFHIIDDRDGSLETLQKRMEGAAGKFDVDLFVIDPLTDILRSLGIDSQENHMMWQKYKKKLGWKIINVLHSRKPGQTKDGELRKVTEFDALGSGTFIQSADWNWVLNRDKMTDDDIERNTMVFDMPKCRGGTTGHITDLYYDAETRQQYDKEDFFSGKVANTTQEYSHGGVEEVSVEYDSQSYEVNGEELVFNTPKE